MWCQVTFQTTLDRSFVWFYLGLNQFSTTTFYYLFILQSSLSVSVCLSVAFPSLLFPFFFLSFALCGFLFLLSTYLRKSVSLSLSSPFSLSSVSSCLIFQSRRVLKSSGIFFQWGRMGKKKSDCQIEVMPKTWVKKEQKIELMMTTTTGTFTYSGVSLSPHLTLQ